MAIDRLIIRRLAPEREDDFLHYFEGAAFPDNPKWKSCYRQFLYVEHATVSLLDSFADEPVPDADPRWRSAQRNEETAMNKDIELYNAALPPAEQAICQLLAEHIDRQLPEAENRIWHAHPVWFLEGNPIVGYSKLKDCVRLLFWSGQSFEEDGLKKEGSFKAAEARYTATGQVDARKLRRWLAEAREIQWDYKNIVRRKGRLERLR